MKQLNLILVTFLPLVSWGHHHPIPHNHAVGSELLYTILVLPLILIGWIVYRKMNKKNS